MSVIVVGCGEIGYNLARKLSLEKMDVTVIDKNIEKVSRAGDLLDVQTIAGSGSSLKVLTQAGIGDADMVIAVTNSDEVNLISCLISGTQTTLPTRIARVKNLEYIDNPEMLKKANLNINLIINPEFETVSTMIKLLQVPGATDIVDFNDGKIKLIGYKVMNPEFETGIKIEDLQRKSGIENMIVVAIYRDGEVVIPGGKDRIFSGNLIYTITTEDNISTTMRFFGSDFQEIRKAMIAGGTTIGVLLAQRFERLGISSKIIDSDEKVCRKLSEKLDKTLVLHCGEEIDVLLSEEHVENTDLFAALTDDEEDNILMALMAKQMGAKKTLALVHNITYSKLVSKLGIDIVVNPNLCAINRILHFIRKGKILSVTSFYEKDAEVIEAIAMETSDIVNKPIAAIKFPKNAIIGAIIRDNKLIIPRGKTVIKPDDHVIIFALSSAVPKVEKKLTVKLEYW